MVNVFILGMRNIERHLKRMFELSNKIQSNLFERGALQIDTKELKIILDDSGFPLYFIPKGQGKADKIIGSFYGYNWRKLCSSL